MQADTTVIIIIIIIIDTRQLLSIIDTRITQTVYRYTLHSCYRAS
jgi:hypothetical protein